MRQLAGCLCSEFWRQYHDEKKSEGGSLVWRFVVWRRFWRFGRGIREGRDALIMGWLVPLL